MNFFLESPIDRGGYSSHRPYIPKIRKNFSVKWNVSGKPGLFSRSRCQKPKTEVEGYLDTFSKISVPGKLDWLQYRKRGGGVIDTICSGMRNSLENALAVLVYFLNCWGTAKRIKYFSQQYVHVTSGTNKFAKTLGNEYVEEGELK